MKSRILRLLPILLIPAALLLSSCEELSPLGGFIYNRLALDSPTISSTADANGYSNTDITITLTPPASTPDAVLRYTIDRSDPSGGTVYTAPFVIGGHNTPILVKAVAQKDLSIDSTTASAEFLILYDSAEPPVFSPAAGSYTTDQSISINSASSGAEIWYTDDGTDPRTSSTRILYDGNPITLTDDGTPDGAQVVFNAVSQVAGLPDSPLVSAAYSVLYETLSAPTLSPASAQSIEPVTVTLSSSDGAEIWYTLDGSSPLRTVNGMEVPSTGARLYTESLSVDWSGYDSRTIKAACVDVQRRSSAVQIGSYFYQVSQTDAPSAEIFNGADGITVNFDGSSFRTNLTSPRIRTISGQSDTRYFYTIDGSMPLIDVDGDTVTNLNPFSTKELAYNGDADVSAAPLGEGTHTIGLLAVQEGKEASDLVQIDLDVDLTPPSVPDLTHTLFEGEDGNTYLNAALYGGGWSMTASTTAGDGAGEFQWRWQGDSTWNDVSGDTISGGTLEPGIGGQGMWQLEIREFDTAGNASSIITTPIFLDTISPSLTGSVEPIHQDSGYPRNLAGLYYFDFDEPIASTDCNIRIEHAGGAVTQPQISGSRVTLIDHIVDAPDLPIDADLTLYAESVTDMAGNTANIGRTAEFASGAIFWSVGGTIFKSPISPRIDWPDRGSKRWADDSIAITDIEVSNGVVYWSLLDGGGVVYSCRALEAPDDGHWADVVSVVSAPDEIEDIEIYNGSLYYTTRNDGATTVRSYNLTSFATTNRVTNIDDSTRPYGLAVDGTVGMMWASSAMYNIFTTGSADYSADTALGGISGCEGVDILYSGADHLVYGIREAQYAVPSGPNGNSYITKYTLNHGGTGTYTLVSENSLSTSPSGTWGNGVAYGGDVEAVDVDGFRDVFVNIPICTDSPPTAASTEYGAVFQFDENLSSSVKLYDPFEEGLIASWNDWYRRYTALAVMTD